MAGARTPEGGNPNCSLSGCRSRVRPVGTARSALKRGWDRRFESRSLQPGVTSEPDILSGWTMRSSPGTTGRLTGSSRPSLILGVRRFHSLEFRQYRHFLKVLGAEARPVDANRRGAGALDADHMGRSRYHTERPIGGVAGHGVDDLQIVHGRRDRHRRVTELAQDGDFQIAVALAL